MGNSRHAKPRPEPVIIDLASRQHALVTRGQLIAAGLTGDMIRSRMRAKLLFPIHRGVYRVGPVATPNERERAAVLACGSGAVVSHRSAASLWGFLPPQGDAAPVDITVPNREPRREGIRVHRVPDLDAEEVSELDGIPITTPARTLVDLGGVVQQRDLEQALARAERQELAQVSDVQSVMDRRPNRPGTRLLRRVLGTEGGPALTRSQAERLFLTLIRKAELPAPEVNVAVGQYEVDFLWRSEGLVVEVDGYAFHSSRRQFESDRSRDAVLAAEGFRVIRITWLQLTKKPEAVLVRLTRALFTK